MLNAKTQTSESQSAITPSKAMELLNAGNQRFLAGNRLNRHWLKQVRETAAGQYPFAAVVSCIDSRVPVEIVFDQGIGDIFCARIAGNFVNTDILGSLEFACKSAGAKLVLVLGHTSCGAVKGACDGVALGNLTAMLEKLKPSVDFIAQKTGRQPSGSDADFVQAVVDHNIDRTMEQIRTESSVLAEMEEKGAIAIGGALYDVSTGKVTFR